MGEPGTHAGTAFTPRSSDGNSPHVHRTVPSAELPPWIKELKKSDLHIATGKHRQQCASKKATGDEHENDHRTNRGTSCNAASYSRIGSTAASQSVLMTAPSAKKQVSC